MVKSVKTFDMQKFDSFLESKSLSPQNRRAIVKQAKKLTSGEGVAHKGRPDQRFCAGEAITPQDDLKALQAKAAAWLPFRKTDGDRALVLAVT